MAFPRRWARAAGRLSAEPGNATSVSGNRPQGSRASGAVLRSDMASLVIALMRYQHSEGE
jgi:hypothetical protein